MPLSLGSDFDLDQAKLQFDEYGYLALPDLIPRDDALGMADRLMELTRSQGETDGGGYRSLQCLFNYLDPLEYERFFPLALNPIVLELAGHALGERFQMIGSNVVWREPGAPAHALHADSPMGWFAEQALPIPRNLCFLVQCNWILTDFTIENGATQFLPISHLLDPPNKWLEDGEEKFLNDRVRHLRAEIENGDPMGRLMTAVGSAGSAVLFHGAMWHRAGANVTSDRQRVGVLTPYHARWVEPVYGLQLPESLMQRDVRDRMPEEIRRMCLHVQEDYPDREIV
jgi:hypothetical protein